MTRHNFSQKMTNPLEKPMQELIDLHVHTAQKLAFISPIEWFSVLKPEEVLERNINVMVKNGHETIDYIHNLFSIMEKNWFNISDSMMTKAQDNIKKSVSDTENMVKQATTSAKRTIKKTVSATKKTAKKNIKSVLASARKSQKNPVRMMKKTMKKSAKIVGNHSRI